jgi:hypothetical protein
LATLGFLMAAVGPTAAVTVEDSEIPESPTVGDRVSGTVTLGELYRNPSYESWSLRGTTELRNVTWTVEFFDQTGSKVDQRDVDGKRLDVDGIDANAGVSEVVVTVTGQVPPIGDGNYTFPDRERFTVANLEQAREGGTAAEIDSWEAVHGTPNSRQARQQLTDARSAIETAKSQGLDVTEAETTFDAAVSAYENANFQNAVNLAAQARNTASEAVSQSETQSQRIQFLLVGAGVVVVLGIVGGGIYLYRQRQQSSTRLR